MTIKKLTILSSLIAMQVVLSRFLSIQMWNFKIGFGFVPVVIAAILFGPVEAGITGGISDVIGALLFPTGAFFPGFTLTAILIGLVFGLFLHKKQNAQRIVGAVILNQLIFSLLLNTLWISILYGANYWGLMSTRALQCIIMIPAEIITISVLVPAIKRIEKIMPELRQNEIALKK